MPLCQTEAGAAAIVLVGSCVQHLPWLFLQHFKVLQNSSENFRGTSF